MADKIVFNVSKVEYRDSGTMKDAVNASDWVDIGVTQGGVTMAFELNQLEIPSDQHMDPEAILGTSAPKTITYNLLDLKKENLALLLGGTVDGTAVNIATTPSMINKGFRITTVSASGIARLVVLVPKASIIPGTTLNLNSSGAAVGVLTTKILAPETYTITGCGWTSEASIITGTNFTTANYIGKGNIIMLPDGTSVKASAVTATQVTVTNLDGTPYTFGATASSQTITVTSDVVKMTY